jgi:hypothetical protein
MTRYFRDADEARQAGYTFTWSPDKISVGWSSHAEQYGPGSAYDPAQGGTEPEQCEQADIIDPAGNVVGSLGCIDDADDDYRLEIENDLARDVEIPTRRAYRVSRTVAAAAFACGDGVLITESRDGHGPVWPVPAVSGLVIHRLGGSCTWAQLVDAVDSWGRPQTFYVLPADQA